MIPSFIVENLLRPDIVLYSISIKTAIFLELNWPCEKNMEVWHNKKFEKYHLLSLAMISNGWLVHMFLIEVGARGYWSATVKSCLIRLGFSTSLVKSTFKSLSLTFLKASLQIWLSQDSRKWENVIIPFQFSKELQSQNIKKTYGNPDKWQSVSFNHSFEKLQTKIN